MSGGVPARRAVVRWAWRMLRRERRQQAVVLSLLTVAVAAAVGLGTAAYNTAGVGDDASFGHADQMVEWDAPDPAEARRVEAAAQEWFGDAQVLTRWSRDVPGSVEQVEYRAQEAGARLGRSMLALVDGRLPRAPDEVAVTDYVATLFRLDRGDTFDLDGVRRTVVGVVENPSDLHDEFALVDPSAAGSPDRATLLVPGDRDALDAFVASGRLGVPEFSGGERDRRLGIVAAATVMTAAGVVMVLVALLATAGFAVVAQRRLRQLGMLAAIGATERHLRLVMVANGAIVGLVAAVVGGALGLAGWLVAAPNMEEAVGHRIDPAHVPVAIVAGTMALAVVAATGSAWWPARTAARVPAVLALTGRPPVPRPAHRSAGLAVVLVVAGVVGLAGAGSGSTWRSLAGTVAVVAGVLLVCPSAVRGLGVVARRLPVGGRLALRDLARHQARSAAAVAAVSLVAGIPAAVILTASAAENGPEEGNLAADQLLVWTRGPDDPEGYSPFYSEDPNDSGFAPFPPDLSHTELRAMERQAEAIAAELGDDAEVTPLDVAVDPQLAPSELGKSSVTLGRPREDGYLDVALVYVATPGLVGRYGVDLDELDGDVEVLTTRSEGRLAYTNVLNRESGDTRPEAVRALERLEPGYSSLPGSFITPEALRRRGWDTTRIGWLVETGAAVTDEQFARARAQALDAGLLVEARAGQASLRDLRSGATAVGVALALAVLGMTVGLLRAEGARDLRTLAAAGASGRVRRSLTAATAGSLALLGVALGIGGAYVGFGALHHDGLHVLLPVPVTHLLAVAAGVPAAATAAGWLVAGRPPAHLARPAAD